MKTTTLIQPFDYGICSLGTAKLIQGNLERIKQLYRQTVYTALDIGLLLLEIKAALVEQRIYGKWIDSEFPWGHSTANQLENVALRFANVQCLDKFDLTALYVLAAPSTEESTRSTAIALAGKGEHISGTRAKRLKLNSDLPTLKANSQVVVQNGDYKGETVTIQNFDKHGLVSVRGNCGETTLLVSELLPELPSNKTKYKDKTTSHIEAIAVELDIETNRVALLEESLRRIIHAARHQQITAQMLLDIESIL